MLPMTNQWSCKGIKLNDKIALPGSFWRNQKSSPFEKAQSGRFIAILFPSALLWSLRKSNLNMFLISPLGTIKAATRHYRVGGWDSKSWDPNFGPPIFKRTPHMICIRVSARAKANCKMTARVFSFDLKNIRPRLARNDDKIEKNMILQVFLAVLRIVVCPTRNVFISKKRLFRTFFVACFGWLCFVSPLFTFPCLAATKVYVRAGYTGLKKELNEMLLNNVLKRTLTLTSARRFMANPRRLLKNPVRHQHTCSWVYIIKS